MRAGAPGPRDRPEDAQGSYESSPELSGILRRQSKRRLPPPVARQEHEGCTTEVAFGEAFFASEGSPPERPVHWNGLLAGMLTGSLLLAAPVLWSGIVGHGSLRGVPWPMTIEVLSPLMLAVYALMVVLIVERERRAFVSLLHVLDQKTAENTLLVRKFIASGGDGQRFRDLLQGVTTFLKDGSVDFATRKRLWSTLTKSSELEVPLTNAMKEPDRPGQADRVGSPPLTSPASEGQA